MSEPSPREQVMSLLAGIDIGTSSLKVVLADAAGRVRSSAVAEYPLHTPAPGVAEQDPEHWWAALREAMAAALASCGGGAHVVALGLSGQMHGIVPLGEDDRPLRRAIIWADQRGADLATAIEAQVGREALIAHTGSRAAVGFSAPKILWLRQNEPALFARCKRLLLPKDYLRLRLTGEAASEPSDASGTLLFDIVRRDWSPWLLEALQLPSTLFPPLVPTLGVAGRLRPAVAEELGLPPGIPVVAGAADTPAQAAAYGGLRVGTVLATLSSGGQLLAPIRQPLIDPQGRIHTLCHVLPEVWYLLGAMQAAGLALRWLRDLLSPAGLPLSYDALVAEAAAAPPGSAGLIFLPYLLGERTPHMDNDARAVFFGLTIRHGRAELARAVLEGVAFAFRDGVEVIRALGVPITELRVGGGGSRSALWRAIMADVLGMPVTLTDADQGAAHGAALIAGAGIGLLPDLEQISAAVVRPVAVSEPDSARAGRYEEQFARYQALYAAVRGLWPPP